MKKAFFLLLLITIITLCIPSCGRYDIKVVRQVPSGFISLKEACDSTEGALRYVFWETQLSFLDADDKCIYQTNVNNSDFIVKYRGENYINEEKILELIEIAIIAPEIRRKTFGVGEMIEILGAGETMFTVLVKAVEIGDTVNSGYAYDLTTFYIKYSFQSNIYKDERLDFNFIRTVITKEGVSYSNLNYIDIEDERIAVVTIRDRGNSDIELIILGSPDFSGLEYTVLVDE